MQFFIKLSKVNSDWAESFGNKTSQWISCQPTDPFEGNIPCQLSTPTSAP